jgi:hypothetical protein
MANMIEWLLEDNTAINYLSHFCPGNIPSFKPVWEKDDFMNKASGIVYPSKELANTKQIFSKLLNIPYVAI